MKKFYRILILIIIGFFSAAAVAGDYGRGQQEPLPREMLPQPIALNGACKEIKIIEWRPTQGHINSTKLTKKAVSVVNSTCNVAVQSFYSFISLKGKYTISKSTIFDTSLSFMPADMSRDGNKPRNLNDLRYRFAYRSDQNILWGWFQRDSDWAYIRNDVLKDDEKTINETFVKVTAHELFHAMSYASGVFHQHKPKPKKDAIEEAMAQEFTEYLGLGK